MWLYALRQSLWQCDNTQGKYDLFKKVHKVHLFAGELKYWSGYQWNMHGILLRKYIIETCSTRLRRLSVINS